MKKIETERKRMLTESDLSSLVGNLHANGYQYTSNKRETDTYYTRMDVDYIETVECLRIRERDTYVEITYKPPSNNMTVKYNIISKQEVNVRLYSQEETEHAKLLLKSIGMIELAVVKKQRCRYTNPAQPHVSIYIDDLCGLGKFVEVEILSTDQTCAQRMLADIEYQLKISDCIIASLPYRDMAMMQQAH